MVSNKFDPPGLLGDITQSADIAAWSDLISKLFDEARNGSGSGLQNDSPRLQFFNPLKEPLSSDAQEEDITWSAFPRIVQMSSTSEHQRWQRADSDRNLQDEYCEWSVEREPTSGKIVRVSFTSEGPEYWDYLAKHARDKVVSLYQQHISSEVKATDLFDSSGNYLPMNKWNNSTLTGAMHLIQENNTLSAEIELAAAATIVRVKDGQTLTTEPELIACGRYGDARRHSDPHIGAAVNALARSKADITLANPIGLYIASLSTIGWKTPDGSPPINYWSITRGTEKKALRAIYQVPASKNFVVGDIEINGKLIEFGSQIADFITIKLTGLATRIGKSNVQPFNGCATPASSHMMRIAPFALRSHR